MKGQPFHLAGAQFPYGYRGYPESSVPDLSRLGRLVGLGCVAAVGSLGNIYTISSCIVGDRLRKKGNVFIVNLSLAMLLVTLLVLPSLAFHVLAGKDVSEQTRRLHEHLVELCGCVSLFTLCAVALENYVRLCHWRAHRRLVGRGCVATGLALVWALGGGALATALLASAGPHGHVHALLLAGMTGAAAAATGAVYLLVWRRVRHLRRCTCHPRGRGRPMPWDVQLVRANAAVWLSFCLAWLPPGGVRTLGPWLAAAGQQPGRPDDWLTWLPLAHATAFNALYVLLNEDFRESYVNLAQYCCCKMSVHFGKRPRSDLPRPLLIETRKSSMRVHMMPGYDMRAVSYADPAPGRAVSRHPSTVSRASSTAGVRMGML